MTNGRINSAADDHPDIKFNAGVNDQRFDQYDDPQYGKDVIMLLPIMLPTEISLPGIGHNRRGQFERCSDRNNHQADNRI